MFNNGFQQYLSSGLYSDLTLIVNHKTYRVHRIIVGFSSEYFSNILQTIQHLGPDIFDSPSTTPYAASSGTPPSSPPSSPKISLIKTVPSFSPILNLSFNSSSLTNGSNISTAMNGSTSLPTTPTHHQYQQSITTTTTNNTNINNTNHHTPASRILTQHHQQQQQQQTTRHSLPPSSSSSNNTSTTSSSFIKKSSNLIPEIHQQQQHQQTDTNNNKHMPTSPPTSSSKQRSSTSFSKSISALLSTVGSSSSKKSSSSSTSISPKGHNKKDSVDTATTTASGQLTPTKKSHHKSISADNTITTTAGSKPTPPSKTLTPIIQEQSNQQPQQQQQQQQLIHKSSTPNLTVVIPNSSLSNSSSSTSSLVSLSSISSSTSTSSISSSTSSQLPLIVDESTPSSSLSISSLSLDNQPHQQQHHHHHHHHHHHVSTTNTSSTNQPQPQQQQQQVNRKDSTNSFIIPVSYIRQQFHSHNPKPTLKWEGNHLVIEINIQEDAESEDVEDTTNGNNNNNSSSSSSSSNSHHLFDQIISYMYRGKIDINDQNCIGILHYANRFLIHSLRKLAFNYITEHISAKNVLQWLHNAIEFKIEDLIPKCIVIIARNFSSIIENTKNTKNSKNLFSFIPFDSFIQILDHHSLSVFSEFTVYQSICNYIESRQHIQQQQQQQHNQQQQQKMLTPSQIVKLFQKVRFSYLTYQEFQQVISNQLVPQDLLTEGLMIRLGLQECPNSLFVQSRLNEPRFMKRKTSGRLFEYTFDYDNKGVFYYIGTNGYTTEWSNPALPSTSSNGGEIEPKVKISFSSIEKGNPSDVLELKATECWSKDIPSSWFSIDFGNRLINPRYYTLRHGGNSKQDCLRNWVLQASDDGADWITISRHSNEHFLNSNFASHSWPIPNCTQSYRYFRILQTGHNSTNLNFLSISGIEFYGELIDEDSPPQSSSTTNTSSS